MRRAHSAQSESPTPGRRLYRKGVGSTTSSPPQWSDPRRGWEPEWDASRTSTAKKWAYDRRAADTLCIVGTRREVSFGCLCWGDEWTYGGGGSAMPSDVPSA